VKIFEEILSRLKLKIFLLFLTEEGIFLTYLDEGSIIFRVCVFVRCPIFDFEVNGGCKVLFFIKLVLC